MDVCFRGRVGRQMTRMILGLCVALFACSAVWANPSAYAEEQSSAKSVGATISPLLAKVPTGGEVQFVVTIAGEPDKSAEWLVNGIPGGNDTIGTIAGGVYHSPAVAPIPNEMHIQAKLAKGGRSLFSTVIVGRCEPAYKLVNRWTTDKLTEGRLDENHGICLDQAGNVVVTDPTGGRVCRYTRDGKFLDQIGSGKGTGPGFFDGPRDAKVDSKGRIFVIDGNLNNVQRFDPDGKIVVSKSVAEGGKTDLKRPHSIAIDASGRMYLADVDNKRAVVFDEECRFVMGWPTPPVGSEKKLAPHSTGVDPNGDVFVVDYNGTCYKYTGSGEMLFSFAQIHGQYHAMCTDRWGDVYFAARNRADTLGRIDKYNNNGVLVVSWVLEREGGPGYPKCLAVDNEGNVYATDNEGVDVFAPTSTETVIE